MGMPRLNSSRAGKSVLPHHGIARCHAGSCGAAAGGSGGLPAAQPAWGSRHSGLLPAGGLGGGCCPCTRAAPCPRQPQDPPWHPATGDRRGGALAWPLVCWPESRSGVSGFRMAGTTEPKRWQDLDLSCQACGPFFTAMWGRSCTLNACWARPPRQGPVCKKNDQISKRMVQLLPCLVHPQACLCMGFTMSAMQALLCSAATTPSCLPFPWQAPPFPALSCHCCPTGPWRCSAWTPPRRSYTRSYGRGCRGPCAHGHGRLCWRQARPGMGGPDSPPRSPAGVSMAPVGAATLSWRHRELMAVLALMWELWLMLCSWYCDACALQPASRFSGLSTTILALQHKSRPTPGPACQWWLAMCLDLGNGGFQLAVSYHLGIPPYSGVIPSLPWTTGSTP